MDRGIAEILQKNLRRRLCQYPRRLGCSAKERVLHSIWRRAVVGSDIDPHRVQRGRIMQIDDGLLDDLVVRQLEIDPVIRAQPGRSPIDFDHLSELVADLEPIAQFIRRPDLKRHAREDTAEQILRGETKDDRGHAGAGEQSLQLRLGVITDTQDEQERDKKKAERNRVAQESRDDDVTPLFVVIIPEVTVEQRHDHGGAKKNENGPEMVAPIRVQSINAERGVEGEREAKQLKENPEADTGPAFQEPAERESDQVSRDENRDGHERVLPLIDEMKHERQGQRIRPLRRDKFRDLPRRRDRQPGPTDQKTQAADRRDRAEPSLVCKGENVETAAENHDARH